MKSVWILLSLMSGTSSAMETGGVAAAPPEVATQLLDLVQPVTPRGAQAPFVDQGISAVQIGDGRMSVRQVAVEEFRLRDDEEPFDLAFAVRVGALDGRHPRAGERALARIREALTPTGRLYVDGGDPLREVTLPGG